MPLRAVVLGQVPSDLLATLTSCAASMALTLEGPCADRASALAALSPSGPVAPPDVVLLGPSLTDGPSWPLLRDLPAAKRPSAVLVLGARDEDALAAFDVQATDFVRWPSPTSRLEEALTRVRQAALQAAVLRTADDLQRLLAEVAAAGGADLSGLFPKSGEGPRKGRSNASPHSGTLVPTAPWRAASRTVDGRVVRVRDVGEEAVLDLSQEDGGRGTSEGRPLRVLVREGRRTRFVSLADIDWFEADGNYIKVHASGGAHRTRGTISAIESALDPRQFVRIHRRIVVNMDRVREMTPLPGGDGLLVLGDGATLRLSRTYRARVR